MLTAVQCDRQTEGWDCLDVVGVVGDVGMVEVVGTGIVGGVV